MEETQKLDCNKIEIAFDPEARKSLDTLKEFFKFKDDATLMTNSLRFMDWYRQQLINNTQVLLRDSKNKVIEVTFKF